MRFEAQASNFMILVGNRGPRTIGQMDVPARQAHLARIVAREERTAANAAATTVRNVACAAVPFSPGDLIAVLVLQPLFSWRVA